MPRSTDDTDRQVMARLPFWFKQMAMDVGRRRSPPESVADVLVRLAGKRLRKEHDKMPKLRSTELEGSQA